MVARRLALLPVCSDTVLVYFVEMRQGRHPPPTLYDSEALISEHEAAKTRAAEQQEELQALWVEPAVGARVEPTALV